MENEDLGFQAQNTDPKDFKSTLLAPIPVRFRLSLFGVDYSLILPSVVHRDTLE